MKLYLDKIGDIWGSSVRNDFFAMGWMRLAEDETIGLFGANSRSPPIMTKNVRQSWKS